MCRIFGQFGQSDICEFSLRQAAVAMKHGGPDCQSYKMDRQWALGNDRLSIQGVVGGDQPFTSQKNICVVYNGEIYNHRTLRKDLIRQGFTFKDDCDGNVIAPLFQVYGPDFVKYIDGMFAIAIVDAREHPELHIFTDPAAIKSIYYRWDEHNNALSFASEIDGLAYLTQQSLDIDPLKIFDYLSLRAVCGEDSIYKNIRTLGPSRYLHCALGQKPKITTYNSALKAPTPRFDLAAAGFQFRELLNQEVRRMMDADVPICVVTSGGLDSTFLSALAAQVKDELHSFHICYKGDWPHDERYYARESAQHFGTKHHEIEIDPDTFPDLILRMTQHMGQPNTAPHSLSTYCLFQSIHEAGFRAAITGEGSDELFAGYERFASALSSQDDWIPGYMDKFGPFPAKIRADILAKDFLVHTNQTSSRIDEFIGRILSTTPGADRLDALQALDQWDRFPYYILRRVDHLSMAHAVEVRVPFCQPRILDYARQLPVEHRLSGDKYKRIVYEAARGLIPESVMTRKKQPFTLPITAMIRPGTKLFDFMTDTLSSKRFCERGLFQSAKIRHYCDQQATAPTDGVANMLWSVMSLELWQQHVEQLNAKLQFNNRRSLTISPRPESHTFK